MKNSRSRLPQLDGGLFLTDGGIETTLILPGGVRPALFRGVSPAAQRAGHRRRCAGITRATLRSRASAASGSCWKAPPGGPAPTGARGSATRPASSTAANRAAIDLLHDLRRELETERSPMVISGCVGPRGDGYRPDAVMTPGGGARLSRRADSRLRGGRRRSRHRHHDDQQRRSDRHRARRAGGGPAGGHFVHRRNRRTAAERRNAGGGDCRGRRRDRWSRAVLHDQLRPSRRISPARWRPVSAWVAAHSRHPRQCVDVQPRGARRGDDARCR